MKAAVSILVADQDLLVSSALGVALRRCVSECPDLAVVDDHPRTRDALARAVGEHAPEVALVGTPLAGTTGAEATRAALAVRADLKLLLLGRECDPEGLREALAAGAVGFLPKSLDVRTVAEGIYRAHAGEAPVFAEQLRVLVRLIRRRRRRQAQMRERLAQLSPRQGEVLALMHAGLPVEGIADQLGLAVPTVRAHIQKLLSRLNVRSQVEAVAVARDLGALGQRTPSDPPPPP